MLMNHKEKIIVHYLLKTDGYLTANDLSKKSGFSKKTIYRTINELNQSLEENAFVSSKIGKGYRINYEKYSYVNNEQGKNKKGVKEPRDRRSFVFLKLLFKSPIKINLYDVYEEFYVSEDTIAKDLKAINDYAVIHQVSLHRKKGQIWITGKENNIRNAINKVINSLNLISFESFPANINLNSTDSNHILYLISKLEKSIGFPINYPYNINVFLHIYILVNRIREGNIADIYCDNNIRSSEEDLIKSNQGLFNLAENTIEDLSKYLHYAIDPMESFFLFQYLISSRIELLDNQTSEENSLEVCITKQLIANVSNQLNRDLNDEVLQKDLLNHIMPMINRVYNGISVKNVLLPDILDEYFQLFHIVKTACNQIKKKNSIFALSDDEIGFLTLYFAKNIEQNHGRPNILIICTTGVGTSELLKTKVKKYFPNLDIAGLLSISEFHKRQNTFKYIDGILSTVHLVDTNDIPCLIVNALFTSQDRKRMEKFIKQLEEKENEE